MMNTIVGTARKVERLTQIADQRQNDYKIREARINPKAKETLQEGREDAGAVVQPSWLKK